MSGFEPEALELLGYCRSALDISAILQMLCKVNKNRKMISGQCHVIFLKNGYVSTT